MIESFTNQKPFVATKEHLSLNWNGGQAGSQFRCGLCGYQFSVGDSVRWVYTNNMPGYGGNPFTCSKCDGDDFLQRWKALWNEYRLISNDPRFWFMRRREFRDQ